VRGFGELEAAIMHRLWDFAVPATVREVLTDLRAGRQIAYTTVLTVMDNLYKKGWLHREPDGRAYRYRPVATREEYSALIMREALDGSGDRAAALLHFLDTMSAEETSALRTALEQYQRRSADQ
jgi:predicted transcriptional regulator